MALARYIEVAERSGVFSEGWRPWVIGTELQQICRTTFLVLAMLQHPTRAWSWGRFVLAYPSRNPSFSRAAAQYKRLLRDSSTFAANTLEELVQTQGALDGPTVTAFRERYLRW